MRAAATGAEDALVRAAADPFAMVVVLALLLYLEEERGTLLPAAVRPPALDAKHKFRKSTKGFRN